MTMKKVIAEHIRQQWPLSLFYTNDVNETKTQKLLTTMMKILTKAKPKEYGHKLMHINRII